jgi:uncharacterized membrane protein YqjE
VRLLWSLPKAAPALLRHLAAYVDLAGLDLARAQREIAGQIFSVAILILCGLFALVMGCLAVVAYTWDTPHRVSAIVWMGVVFLSIAIVAALYLARAARSRSEFLASLRREWREDRVLLERVLSDQEGSP